MKICITGATGFIGSRMALYFIEQGHEVVILALINNEHEKANSAMLASKGVKVVIGDVSQIEKVKESLNGVDWVFHLAAAQHEAGVPDEYFRRINVDGTKAMLEASLEMGVKRFIYGSTIGVYGYAMDGELDEESRLEPANIYGVTKLEAERLVLSYQDKMPVTAIRISETYGPGDRRLLKLFKGIRKNRFFIIGDGENIHQLIYVDDLIRGMEKAASSEEAIGEVFVLAGAEKLSTTDMCRAVGSALNKNRSLPKFPMWPFTILAIIMEKVFPLIGKEPPLHRRRLDFFAKSFYFKNNKAISKLDFSPQTSFERGAELTAQWYQSEELV